ncbi:MAG: hypothetical protein K2X27_10300 [Candidatus Obscuribacterales bacterium]|nr:hypothetical protein [Candidatus Obscuribacterales bacterium]
MSDFILAEFKGTYRAPHPDGVRDANITKPFHVKVKMLRSNLKAPGLKGLFATYYKDFLRNAYTDMIDTYEFDLVQATELDGSVIHDPKALSYDGLLEHISRHHYPINPMLYPRHELRNEVVLYETDKAGQQHLQERLQKLKGNALETAAQLQRVEDVLVVVKPDAEPVAAGKAKGKKDPSEAFS